MHFFYDAQSRPAMVDFNGALYSYIHNLQGDVVGIVDSAGSLVVEYKYDAWGKPTLVRTLTTAYEALAELNPFRYRGYVYDEETGLYYLRSRYYSTQQGRPINADTVLGFVASICSHNVFSYCYNNTPIHKDPTGNEAILAGTASLGYGLVQLLLMFGTFLWTVSIPTASEVDVPQTRSEPSASPEPSTSPSPQPTPAPQATPSPTITPAPKRIYYLAVAYGGASPVPVSPAMTLEEVYAIVHVTNATRIIQEYADQTNNTGTPVAYGVYTRYDKDARNLASRFGSPRYDLGDGLKFQHYNVDTYGYEDLHFWFFV